MDVTNLDAKWALVTGAGSGIGRALALAMARRGADLVICDLNPEWLAAARGEIEATGSRVIAAEVDVANREAMRAFAEEVHGLIPAVDLLVNNAGIGIAALFVDHPLEEWDRIVGINLMGVVHGCHFFVPHMIERAQGGHVVNISSMAGFTAVGNMTSYNATKFAVRGFSESLAGELSVHGIGVTAVCPGIINTPIVRNMTVYGPDPEESRRQATRTFTRRNYGPERLAEGILSAIQGDKIVAPITIEARLFWKLTRWTPGLVHWINRRASKRLAEETARAARP